MTVRPCDNPFRVDQFERLPFEPQHVDWPTLRRRLVELEHTAAIVGPHGSGKTTLLLELRRQLQEEGWSVRFVHLQRQDRGAPASFLRPAASREIRLLDGAGHLSGWSWHRVRRAAASGAGLIVTHHPLPSGKPRLPALIRTTVDPALLARLGHSLAGDAFDRLCPEPRMMLERHEGNIRSVWFELFDRCAERSD